MPNLVVKFAVYGALPGGNSNMAQAFDVSEELQTRINQNAGIVQCNNNSFGDPSFGNDKHFGALVTRDNDDLYFACNEGQTIDFNHGGGNPRGAPTPTQEALVVKFAVYGALPGGNLSAAHAFDVTRILQDRLNLSNGPVTCNNDSFGDPSPGNKKHFAAIVRHRNQEDFRFACEEGQTIDFRNAG